MSEKPKATRDDGHGHEDLLEQIFTQGLEKIKAPPPMESTSEAPASETPPAPQQEDSGGAAPPADRKRRRSAVYLYLLVLFGAAFLMLLLAYFVQRRNSESALSDLRDSMNLSRAELLEQIAALEEQNDMLNRDLALCQEHYDELERSTSNVLNQLMYNMQEKLYAWDSFWTLEQFYRMENYQACAAILLLQEQSEYTYTPPDAVQSRYEEIVQAVIDAGILDVAYKQHTEDFQDLLDAFSTP